MSVRILTWRDLADFKQTVRLSGVSFILRARWNTSREFWTLDIFAADATPLILGQKLVLNTDILARYSDDRLPPGRIYAIDTTNIAEVSDGGEVIARIKRDDIGESVFIVYEEP